MHHGSLLHLSIRKVTFVNNSQRSLLLGVTKNWCHKSSGHLFKIYQSPYGLISRCWRREIGRILLYICGANMSLSFRDKNAANIESTDCDVTKTRLIFRPGFFRPYVQQGCSVHPKKKWLDIFAFGRPILVMSNKRYLWLIMNVLI